MVLVGLSAALFCPVMNLLLPKLVGDETAPAELMLVLSEVAAQAQMSGYVTLNPEQADWLADAAKRTHRVYREVLWANRRDL